MNYMIINQNAPNNGDRAVFYFMLREIAKTGVQSLTVSTSNPGLWKNLREFNGMQIEYVHWSGSAMVRPGRSITARIWRRVYTRYLLPLIHRMTQTAYLNSWPIRRAAWLTALCCSEMATAVRKTDAVLTTGGHRLTTILDKDMICRQRLDMTLACLFKKPVVLWSQSIGPFVFSNERDREHAQKLLQDSVRIYVRDHTSVGEVKKMGVPPDRVFETMDSVFGLRDIPDPDKSPAPSKREPVLGVAVYARPKSVVEVDRYGAAVAAAVNRAIKLGYTVRFFPMEIDNRLEQQYIAAVLKHVKNPAVCKIMPDNMDTPTHLREVAKCRAFIAHKTHAVVFALLSAVPLLAIAYHSKTEDFMKQFGLSDYCVPDAQQSPERLATCFDAVNRDLDQIAGKQLEVSRVLDRQVKEDFRALMQLLKNDAAWVA